jgi:hypothetical protein
MRPPIEGCEAGIEVGFFVVIAVVMEDHWAGARKGRRLCGTPPHATSLRTGPGAARRFESGRV